MPVMVKRRRVSGLFFGQQSMLLGMEAQHVIMLRLAKLARGGPGSGPEAVKMVTEKLATAQSAGGIMLQHGLTGRPDLAAGKIMRLYRGKVRANRRRLQK